MAPDRGSSDSSDPMPPEQQPSHGQNRQARFLNDGAGDEERQSEPSETDSLMHTQSYMNAQRSLAERASQPQNFTLRGVLVGLVLGVVVCFSNVYFGLQTGWISGMAMPSALLGFGFFRTISSHLKLPFSPVENVLIQTVASSVGVMPLGAGLVGVVPALEYLMKPSENGPLHIDFKRLCIWAIGVSLFGVAIGVPLRKQVIIREKLKFPTGSATALMIAVLHGKKTGAALIRQHNERTIALQAGTQADRPENTDDLARQDTSRSSVLDPETVTTDWRRRVRLLFLAFTVSALYTIFSYFVPQSRNIPVFGLQLATNWLWTLNPSPAYIGQGIIMGQATATHMLIGAIVGWGILSPLAKSKGWAPGPVNDWETGSKGWIVWVSLAIMFADAIISISWLVLRPVVNFAKRHGREALSLARQGQWTELRRTLISRPNTSHRAQGYSALPPDAASTSIDDSHADDSGISRRRTKGAPEQSLDEDEEADAPPEHQIGPRVFWIVLILALALYFTSVYLAFPLVPVVATIFALLFSCLLSVMSIRALGETDLNPVSGISKLTQLFFAFIIPSNSRNAIAINLLAGAITESAATQAGDLLQDLKTGHLLGAAPSAQFYGQLIGCTLGAVISAAVYRLYTSVYHIPGGLFQIPTAYVWIFTARLVTGRGLPRMAGPYAVYAGIIFAVLTVLRTFGRGTRWAPFIPGGIAVAIGMYNEPNFTLARFIGGMITAYWTKWRGKEETNVVILASGLILGEGLLSIVNLLMASAKVPHLGNAF